MDHVEAASNGQEETDESGTAYFGANIGKWAESKFWNYVERVTGKRSLKSFIRQGLLFTLFSDIPSIWGVALRSQAYKKVLGSIGESCFIERNVRFRVPERIFLGNRVYIGENARLDACFTTSQIRIGNDVSIHEHSTLKAGVGKIIVHEGVTIAGFVGLGGDGGLQIGKNSIIANHVELITGNYVFDDPSIPIKRQGVKLGRIEIGEDVWLGVHTTVLPGVRIGDGAVVGAGSVVTKDIPSYSVAFGNPAEVIRKREKKFKIPFDVALENMDRELPIIISERACSSEIVKKRNRGIIIARP